MEKINPRVDIETNTLKKYEAKGFAEGKQIGIAKGRVEGEQTYSGEKESGSQIIRPAAKSTAEPVYIPRYLQKALKRLKSMVRLFLFSQDGLQAHLLMEYRQSL